ncbi:MAG: hypothetical protein ABIH41_05040 [Nanoarchaeota archaeon]
MTKKQDNTMVYVLGTGLIGILIGAVLAPLWLTAMHGTDMHDDLNTMPMDARREAFIDIKQDIIGNNLAAGGYRCCLEVPCTYCIEKTPGHGEGSTCDCLEDIVNGRHPCGECIGEILEGHGNKYLSNYFAKAIAEEVGEQHLDALRQIMFEKYGIAIEDQA